MEAGYLACARDTQSLSLPKLSWLRPLCCVLLLGLSACTGLPEPEPHEPLSAIVVAPIERLPLPPVVPEPVQAPEQDRPVGILVSSRLPAYEDVADRLVELLGTDDYLLRVIDESTSADLQPIAAQLSAAQPRVVVAIGLDAALLARERIDAPLVFCQVFNYSEYPELEQAAAGVSMLAAFDEQLAFWKGVDESLGVVGTIVGPGHESLITESTSAAVSQGITLEARVSNSDRETVYQFKRLAAEVDGFWLIPDNRILSVNAIEELMSYAASRRLPVVVSTPELLRFGALMSFRPSAIHVADTIVAVLEQLQSFVRNGFEIVTPRAFDVDVNPGVAARLGIGID